jgi:hypothetical protein
MWNHSVLSRPNFCYRFGSSNITQMLEWRRRLVGTMNNAINIGMREVWGGHKPFGLSRADRRQHLYCVGKTGTGKSTLLRNLILQDIENGEGVALLDPHGDLAEEILDCIPPWRTDHVVYFNPGDDAHSVGLNVIGRVPAKYRHVVASGVTGAFKSIWSDSWGPRLEYFLYACVAALLECENVSLLAVQRMLVDERYRAWVVKQVKDPSVRTFWVKEFASYEKKFLAEILSPVRNKVGQLLMAPPMRHILGQVTSTFDPRFMMDNGRILIANLSKGRLGEDKANLLGAILVTQFQLAAMSRVDTPEENRRDFHLYIDEFHNFSTDSFASILSEARKYRLCLTLAHQYTAQLDPTIRDAVFGNVGSLISFRVGDFDAETLERAFGNSYTADQFTGLGNFEVVAKLLDQGQSRESFRGVTLPPSGKTYGTRANITERSRQRYAKPRVAIDRKIERWLI